MKRDQKTLRIVMAQVNLLVGDVIGNAAIIIRSALQARDEYNAAAIIFPELALTSYPPEDLLLRPAMVQQVNNGLNEIRSAVSGIDIIFGYPHYENGAVYNAAAVIRDGEIIGRYFKQQLPNYSVFDEKRYFTAGAEPCVLTIQDVPVGITICEDVWHSGPALQAANAGARLLLNLNASPFHIRRRQQRTEIVKARIKETGIPLLYVNLVGGQDELVFDGDSFMMNAQGEITLQGAAFEEGLYVADFEIRDSGEVVPLAGDPGQELAVDESTYKAIILGIRDYVHKNHFNGVVIGLSGGIDSALTLTLAVDAIGKENVEAVLMPSRYTADISIEDAIAECEALDVDYHIIPIEPTFSAFLDSLREEFAGTAVDSTEENIQARCRGIILMGISNKKRKIVLTTGNKSELSVGYATLYGDMAGGFAPIKDVLKTSVYALAGYRNSIAPVIPQRVLDRPPSAELAPDQKDEDSLPPYAVLDPILQMYIEQDMSPDDIIARGYEADTVRRVVTMVNRNEYKRRQAPPGVRITQRAFGRDRRYPITSGYYENYGYHQKKQQAPRQ